MATGSAGDGAVWLAQAARPRQVQAAAKIALKLLFPLIFCVFPTLMLVLMGPAVIEVYRVLVPAMASR